MVKNHRNMEGGARNRVPEPGKDLKDVVSFEDFKKKVTFYDIDAHGTIPSSRSEKGTIFIVPPKTYVFFVSRAGVPAAKVKTGDLKSEIENLFFLSDTNTSNETWSRRIYKGMEDGTLLKTILYKSDQPFTFNQDKGFSVYEPGDIIQNLHLSFHNPSYPYMMLGIWKLPIRRELKQYLDTINNSFENFQSHIKNQIQQIKTYGESLTDSTKKDVVLNFLVPFYEKYHKLTPEDVEEYKKRDIGTFLLSTPALIPILEEINKIYKAISSVGAKEDYFYNQSDNYLNKFESARVKKETTLYNILHETYSGGTSSGNPILATEDADGNELYRFIVVDACRSLEDKKNIYETRLRRSMSEYLRPEICLTSLITLTKDSFSRLPGLSKLKNTSTIKKLLRGEEVIAADFESELVPLQIGNQKTSYTIPQLLEYHRFSKGDDAYKYTINDMMTQEEFPEAPGQILNVNVGENGSIQYEYFDPYSGESSLVPAMNLWPSIDILYSFLQKEQQQLKQEKEEKKKEKEKMKQMLAAQAALEKQQEEEEKERKRKANERIAALKLEQTLQENKDEATFQDPIIQAEIAKLPPEKQKLISYTHKIRLNLGDPPKADADQKVKDLYNFFHMREGSIKYVYINPTTKGLSVFVISKFLGTGTRLDDRGWNVKFIEAIPPAIKKGGARTKSRKARKSKKQRTRRH